MIRVNEVNHKNKLVARSMFSLHDQGCIQYWNLTLCVFFCQVCLVLLFSVVLLKICCSSVLSLIQQQS